MAASLPLESENTEVLKISGISSNLRKDDTTSISKTIRANYDNLPPGYPAFPIGLVGGIILSEHNKVTPIDSDCDTHPNDPYRRNYLDWQRKKQAERCTVNPNASECKYLCISDPASPICKKDLVPPPLPTPPPKPVISPH